MSTTTTNPKVMDVGTEFTIAGQLGIYELGDSRTVDQKIDGQSREISAGDYAFVIKLAAVIDNNPDARAARRDTAKANEVAFGDVIDVIGYGLHKITKPGRLDGDHPSLVRLGGRS
jgi:hypothetical protein